MACREQGNWKPSSWKPGKLAVYMLHVTKRASWEACKFLGEYEGNKLAAQFRTYLAERKSVAALRARGVALIGDKH